MAPPVRSEGQSADAPAFSQNGAIKLAMRLIVGEASLATLVVLAGLALLAAAWALLSPAHVFSRSKTWDLLFNLSAAWQFHYGHVPHVDFHDALGWLNFWLTDAGFYFYGPSPRAIIVGSIIVAAALLAAGCFVAWRRLPLLASALFVVFCCLIALMPANVGDPPNAYSFAMTYNRYCWSALSILALILFLPPSNGRRGDIADVGIAGGLLLAMYYLKISYFLVGLAAVPLALLVCPHVRVLWRGWIVMAVLVTANALAPYNHAYLLDILAAIKAGGVRHNFTFKLMQFFTNPAEPATYLAGLVAAIWLWRSGAAPLRLPVAAAYLIGSGVALVLQNAQETGIPAAMVIAFLIYDALRQRSASTRLQGVAAAPLLLLAFPLAYIATSALSLVAYRINADSDKMVQVVDRTNLKGLAVPAEPDGLLAAFAAGNGGYALFNRSRAVFPQHELSPFEYVQTILEAADLMAGKRYRRGGIALLDQVNPMAFMLGLPPVRGVNLWLGDTHEVPPVERFFADVDYVLIPKFSTHSPTTDVLAAAYTPFLEQHFLYSEERPSWFLLSRDGPAQPVGLAPISGRLRRKAARSPVEPIWPSFDSQKDSPTVKTLQ
jgi:hypothetical protein